MSKYYAMGIQYDTTDSLGEFDDANLPTNMMVEADDIDQVVDKISDETGWLVSSVFDIIPVDDEDPCQVLLEISTDAGFTSDFLRELADAIDNGMHSKDFETYHGSATISWPRYL